MSAGGERIFRRVGDQVLAIPRFPFEKVPIDGKKHESALQLKLLAEHPELIPGDQMTSGRDDPPRFFLLCWEISTGGGPLDLLFVDQQGVPTLVETKLWCNPESIRKVVGQILDYGSACIAAWDAAVIEQAAQEFYRKERECHLDAALRQFLGESDADLAAFWSVVDRNLKKRAIRLLVAGDTLRPAARRIIEFLNQEMERTEILGLEVSCYGESEDEMVIVPRIVGQAPAVREKKAAARQAINEVNFFEQLRKRTPDSAGAVQQIYDHFNNRAGVEVAWKASSFVVRVPDDAGPVDGYTILWATLDAYQLRGGHLADQMKRAGLDCAKQNHPADKFYRALAFELDSEIAEEEGIAKRFKGPRLADLTVEKAQKVIALADRAVNGIQALLRKRDGDETLD